ncbi:MAG: TlpA disulfide reductase family protein [Saprospiraceae bacterium]|nr:TlpA disulfide reductase family protein [Saprospiraceae bacterium]
MKKNILVLLLSAFALTTYAQKTLPDLNIKNLDGKSVNVRSLAKTGKVTLINFWATWCAPCQKELNNLAKTYTAWQKDYNFELVAVTIDNIQGLAKVKPLVAQKRWAYSVVSDVNSQFLQQLGGQNVPFSVLVDKKGNVVYTHSGYKEGDEIELQKQVAKLAAQQ